MVIDKVETKLKWGQATEILVGPATLLFSVECAIYAETI